ncbi:MAG: hypothetical protein QG670_1099 [Thermoproteota archaeon]|nr:hypothetical protein [Thermoproteota archaeon]
MRVSVLSLPGSNVRLRYTGLISFLSSLFSLLTGAIFVLLITRKLSVEEFGLWNMMSQYLAYVLIFTNVYNYWLPRTIARGINTSRTGLILSLSLGSVATLLYLVIAFWFSLSLNQPLLILLLVTPEVILFYVKSTMDSISTGYAPQLSGYAQMIYESVKVGVAFCLVFFFRVELAGAILAVVVAQLASVLLSAKLNSHVIKSSKLDLDIAKSWLRHSWLPLFGTGVQIVVGLSFILVRLVSGSDQAIAYYGVATTIAGIVANANAMTSGLYPRLLANRHLSEGEMVMKLMYLFALPLSVFIFFYAEPISAIFGLKYLVIANVVRIATLYSLIAILSSLLDTVILGMERRDAERLNSKDLANSMLFKLPLLNYVVSFAYLIILYLLLIGAQGYVEITSRWIISLAISISLGVSMKLIILRSFKIRGLTNIVMSLLRYFAASVISVGIALTIWKVLPVINISDLLLALARPAILTAILYFAVLAVMDRDFRLLINHLVEEAREIFRDLL